VNSEELELSLRSEFENYLKGVQSEMQQQAAELFKKFEAELEHHRSQVAEAFRAYSESFDSEQQLDEAFKSSVLEHLRLARDEGSKIAATAMAEAEDLQERSAPPADYSSLRDAIAEISKQDSQSTILKSLIAHAAQYAPRGAFFIIKSEHFAGWKVLGDESEDLDTAVRDIHFPVASDTILGDAIRSMSTTEGAFGGRADDGSFLDPLHFGQPDRMYAIPLVARGRAVAVMYVDYGSSGLNLNIEALETLVGIAGLTVELLAATHTAAVEARQPGAADFEDAREEHEEQAPAEQVHFEEPAAEEEQAYFTGESKEFVEEQAAPEYVAGEDEISSEVEAAAGDGAEEADAGQISEHVEAPSDFSFAEAETFENPVHEEEPYSGNDEAVHDEFEPAHVDFSETQTVDVGHSEPIAEPELEPAVDLSSETEEAVDFETVDSMEPAAETSPFDTAADFEPAGAAPVASVNSEAAIEVSPLNTGFARLRDRPVDLPIEVPDDERRLHNDARRFARLLVSEIKLYNEKKVAEGREAQDLYERLREAIDRSREMYDKRVQPPVAAKFDYFHYEIVNSLADGEAERLGTGYPGSSV
jgi:hypothetical protein